MNYTINPCKACWEKYKRCDCNINTVNSCVTETAAAFSSIPSNNYIRGTNAGENWQNCMEKMMTAQGRSPCDLQLDMATVWNQAPHHFPSLLAQTGNVDVSKKKCIQACAESRHNKNSCIENCMTDASAVVYHKSKLRERYNDSNTNDYEKARKGNPVVFWIAFIITALVLAFVLTMFYRSLFLRQIGT
jgi:hypothetical protein